MSHPTDDEIRRWLDSGLPVDLDEHIGTCDQCSTTADQLSDESFVGRIRNFLAAPDGFEDRISRRVDLALSRWEALEAMAGMFSVGVHAAALMIGDGPDE